jgi:hypothetical protein
VGIVKYFKRRIEQIVGQQIATFKDLGWCKVKFTRHFRNFQVTIELAPFFDRAVQDGLQFRIFALKSDIYSCRDTHDVDISGSCLTPW